MTEPNLDTVAGQVFAALLADTHLTRPSDLPAVLAAEGRRLGMDELVLYLVDYEQDALVPVPGSPAGHRLVLRVEGTLGGRTFATSTVHESDTGQRDRRRLWLPLIDGTDRLGVMEITVPCSGDRIDPALLGYCERYAHLATQLVITKGAYGDAFELVRRRQPMSVAAELQWRLLPPLVFATRGVVIAGMLEPCYTAGGDTFDYAVNDGLAHLAILDAMGHGLTAAGTAAVALSAYRNARRQRMDLGGTYAVVDSVLVEQFHGERFATGVMARLDLHTGVLRWVNAGHPPPLVLRGGKLIKALERRPSTPLGVPFGDDLVPINEEALEPGDRVLFYTDGVVEARTADGAFFTAERLAQFVERQSAGGLPTPETLRRLGKAILMHQNGVLQDDATALLVEWRRDAELRMVPHTLPA